MSNTTIPDTDEPLIDEWCLFVAAPVDPALVGVRRALARGASVELGRDDTSFAPNVFSDARVSRRHARLEVDDAGVLRVTDLGSSNGTTVNGARVERVSLAVGDVVRIGAALLVVQRTPPRFSLPKSVLPGAGPTLARMQSELARALGSGRNIALVEEQGSGAGRVAREIHRIRGAEQAHEWAMSAWTDRLPTALEQALRAKDKATIVLAGLPPRRSIARSLIIERLRAARTTDDPLLVAVLDMAQPHEPELSESLATVTVPALRDRPEDVVPSAIAWANQRAVAIPALSAKAWLAMLRCPWPGNLAQLEATLDQAREALGRGEEEQIERWIRDAATKAPAARGAIEATAPSAEDNAFVFARSGKWFTLATGERVSLHRREVLRRVLGALVSARDEQPGRVINAEQLIAIAWAGERFIDGSGENRLHVALTNLRQIGLRPIIERVEDGYRLDPMVATRIVEE